MAISKCGSCEKTIFEVKEASPIGSRIKVMLVQCSSCGNVVGTMDYMDIHASVKSVAAAVAAIGGNVDHLTSRIAQIESMLRHR